MGTRLEGLALARPSVSMARERTAHSKFLAISHHQARPKPSLTALLAPTKMQTPHHLSVLLGLSVTLIAWLSPSLSHAQQPRATAVLSVEGQGLDNASSATLTSIIRNEAKQNASFQVINQTQVSLSEVVVLLGCDVSNNSCLAQAASQIKARILVFGRLDKESGGHQMRLEVFDADSQRVTYRMQKLLTDKDFIVAFRMETEAFFKTINQEASAASLIINSNVRGATVRLNGKDEGTTPFERAGLTPGKYLLEVRREGFTSWSAEVELGAGAQLRMAAPLKPVTPTDPITPKEDPDDKVTIKPVDTNDPALSLKKKTSPSQQYDSINWGGWSLVTLGGVSLVGSGVMTILMKDVEQELRDRYDKDLTRPEYDELVARGERYELAQRVLLGVGLASATIGVIWLVADDDDKEGALRLGVGPTGVQAQVQW